MVKKEKDWYKDTNGNIIGDKKQSKGKWNKHFEELLNENKRNNKRAALDMEQNQTHTQNGKMGIQAPTKKPSWPYRS